MQRINMLTFHKVSLEALIADVASLVFIIDKAPQRMKMLTFHKVLW